MNAVPQPPIDRTAIYRAIGAAIVQHLKSAGLAGTLSITTSGSAVESITYTPPGGAPITLSPVPATVKIG